MGLSSRSTSPLQGLRVVDLSPDSVGGQVSQTLADFGADVIWIEPPGGARLRTQRAFPFIARGKRSVVADLRTPPGVDAVRSFATSADVLIESFRPGVADRLGIGYDALQSLNARLVYTSITGFGRDGPWAHLKGYEGVVAAVLGLDACFSAMTSEASPPFLTVPWCAFAASQSALHGTLAALLERERSGRGQWVETNMAQAITVHEGASSSWYSYLVTHRYPDAFAAAPPVSGAVPGHHFMFRLLVAQTKDGRWLQFAQNRPRLFEVFMRELGLDWMFDDPKWQGIPMLPDAGLRQELWQRMLSAVRERTFAEWSQAFDADHDLTGELYRTGPEVLDHPQLLHDRSIVEIQDVERGSVRQPAALCRMTQTPAIIGESAPVLDDSGPGATWRHAEGADSRRHAPPSSYQSERGPLDGVTVLELAIQYAAPYATTMLADLGARVIKIEPLDGDPIRRQIPQFPELGGGKVMQGKDSVALDLQTAEGVEIVHRIAAHADVVLEGFRDGAAERRQVDAESLLRINPDLIYVNARGYGVGGPYGDRAAFAPSFGAAGGIAAAHLGTLGADDPDLDMNAVAARSIVLRSASATKYASADGTGALCAATAALLGLYARTRCGGGQRIVSSMLLSTAHAMASHVVKYDGIPAAMDPGKDLRGPCALYRIYEAADGWVFLAAPQPKEWPGLVRALADVAELASDPRFATPDDRRRNDADLVDVLAGVFARRSKDDWQAKLGAVDVACVAVHTGAPEEVLMSDAHGRASGYLVDVTHPVFDMHPRLAPIVRFSRSTLDPQGAGLCGNATDTVLRELGYSVEQVADMRSRKIVA